MKLVKLIAASLACAAAAAVMSFSVQAEDTDADNYERENFQRQDVWGYTILEDDTVSIGKYYGKDQELEIPDEIDGHTVSAISGGWYLDDGGAPQLYGNIHWIRYGEDGMIEDSQVFSPFTGNTDITSVTIPDSIEYIGAIAFRDCTSLSKVVFPAKLRFIGNNCFEGCTALESIEIPESVEYIDQQAFKDCTALSSVTLHNARFEHAVFENCTALESIDLPDGMTEIPPYMFSGCSSLSSIEFPEGMTTIGSSAFADCTSLTSIKLPSTLFEIYNEAFFGCRSLKSAELNSLEVLGDNAFAGCGFIELTVPASLTRIGKTAFGTTADGKPIDGFLLICPKDSAAQSYAVNNGIAVQTVEVEVDEEEIMIDTPIDPELLFKIVLGIIIAAAAAVLITIVLMIKNQKSSHIKESDEYL